jgi:hypothetical protein
VDFAIFPKIMQQLLYGAIPAQERNALIALYNATKLYRSLKLRILCSFKLSHFHPGQGAFPFVRKFFNKKRLLEEKR